MGRLNELILQDMKESFDGLFSAEWQDGGQQVDTIVATVKDYMADFEEFLMPFWYSKFRDMAMEELTIKYVFTLLENANSENAEAEGDMETFGHVSRDINALNTLFLGVLGDDGKMPAGKSMSMSMSKIEGGGLGV